MNNSTWQLLYGPVPSRRLGRSLGVDLVPYKTCSFDCIYCQLGRTTNKTVERQPYVDPAAILDELGQWLEQDGQADYITFSGLGEPTLNSGLAEMVTAAGEMTDIPLAILTNGSLFWQPEVRAACQAADLLVPSLDAATPNSFEQVNRPARSLDITQIVEGLRLARQECTADMWLEVMLVAGYNDSEEELRALREAIDQIEPQSIQINTVVRPPVEQYARAVSGDTLQEAERLLGRRAQLIAPLDAQSVMAEERQRSEQEVMALLQRRPCTLQDIAAGLAMHPNEGVKYVDALLARQEIAWVQRAGQTFYMVSGDS